MVALALYQPDIPQNLGAMLRLCACLGLPLHVIEPCGFPLNDARIRRAGMDYIDHADWQRHSSWGAFMDYLKAQNGRLIVLSSKAETPYYSHSFAPQDYMLFGRESAGLPEDIHSQADLRLTIPMQSGARSLNLALSAAIIAGEITRQRSPYASQ